MRVSRSRAAAQTLEARVRAAPAQTTGASPRASASAPASRTEATAKPARSLATATPALLLPGCILLTPADRASHDSGSTRTDLDTDVDTDVDGSDDSSVTRREPFYGTSAYVSTFLGVSVL